MNVHVVYKCFVCVKVSKICTVTIFLSRSQIVLSFPIDVPAYVVVWWWRSYNQSVAQVRGFPGDIGCFKCLLQESSSFEEIQPISPTVSYKIPHSSLFINCMISYKKYDFIILFDFFQAFPPWKQWQDFKEQDSETHVESWVPWTVHIAGLRAAVSSKFSCHRSYQSGIKTRG